MVISYPTGKLSGLIQQSDGPLNPILLGSFIKNFATVHNAVVRAADYDDELQTMFFRVTDPETSFYQFRGAYYGNFKRRLLIARLYFVEHGSWTKHQSAVTDEKWLQVLSIDKNSPFKWVMSGVTVALTAAVIISGGDLQISPKDGSIKVHLSPLGVGLQAIRAAMQGGNTPTPIPQLKHSGN